MTFTYDAFGDRIQKDLWTQASGVVTTTRQAYDGIDVWADLDGSSSLTTRYLSGDNVNDFLARVTSTGTVNWLLTDRLGSVRDITDGSGAQIDHVNFDGYGNVTSETDSTKTGLPRWQGMMWEGTLGLYHAGQHR